MAGVLCSKRFGALAPLCALAALLLSLASPAGAEALEVDRSGFAAVPADTVRLDYPLHVQDAEFSTDSPSSFKLGAFDAEVASQVGLGEQDYYGVRPTRSGALPGSFTLKWEGAGEDAAGEAVDLKLTVSDVYVQDQGRWDAPILMTSDSDSPTQPFKMLLEAAGTRASATVEVRATKSATGAPAEGTLLFAASDLDMPDAYAGDPAWNEQVKLDDGFPGPVHVDPSCNLAVTESGTRFAGAGYKQDASSDATRLVAAADPGGFSFSWRGSSAGTPILDPFNVDRQTITATASEGGAISDAGTVVVRWKNDKTYTVTPAEGYRIADVKVDGRSVGKVSSYTFRAVTSSHTISATFEPIPLHTVTFTDGVTGGTVAVREVREGGAAEAPDPPEHDRWVFVRWDGDFSNVTSDMTVGSVYDPVIAVRVPTELPCLLMPDGSVAAPDGYAISNLSPVPVRTSGISTEGMPEGFTYELTDHSGAVVASWDGSQGGEGLGIAADATAPLSWSVSWAERTEESQEAAEAAVQGAVPLCDVAFEFERAGL